MKRTEVDIQSKTNWLQKDQKILSLGSCFGDNIGDLLQKDGYDATVNPAGILFNPYSIELAIKNAIGGTVNPEHYDDYLETHFHYDYHSKTNGANRAEVEQNLKDSLDSTKDLLLNGDRLIVTFGTAWVHRLLRTDQVIANCHKVPQKEFRLEMLILEDLINQWKEVINLLLSQNKELKVLLTVSPVRHTRRGIHENNLSKSTLLLLCDALQQEFKAVSYFPAYEVMLDELRDYSYFKEDLIHPNEAAVQIIYDRFIQNYS